MRGFRILVSDSVERTDGVFPLDDTDLSYTMSDTLYATLARPTSTRDIPTRWPSSAHASFLPAQTLPVRGSDDYRDHSIVSLARLDDGRDGSKPRVSSALDDIDARNCSSARVTGVTRGLILEYPFGRGSHASAAEHHWKQLPLLFLLLTLLEAARYGKRSGRR